MTEDDKLLQKARERFSDSYTSDKNERALASEDIKFAIDDDGCQWPKEIREKREAWPNPRPCITINKIPEKIDQADGEFRQASPSIKIRPVDSKADPKKASLLGGLIRGIEYNSQAKAIYNQAYTQILHGGRAAWRINTIDNDEDPFLKDLVIEPIPNVFTVYSAPNAKLPDKSDAKWKFLTEWITEDDFKEKYPGCELENWAAGDESAKHWRDGKNVRVAQYWYKVKTKKKIYKVERVVNGLIETVVTDEPLETDVEIDSKDIIKETVNYCTMTYNKILDGPKEWPGKYIPIIEVYGKTVNVDGKNKSRGMVRFAKEPAQLYNYWASTITEQIALAPKTPYLMTAKMIGPYQSQWDTAGSENWPYLLYDHDPQVPGGKPTREMPPQVSSGLANELARQDHDIMSSMGIYQASIGDAGQEKSGRAIIARKQQGNIGTFAYTDNFAIGLTFSGRVLLDLVPHVYDTERVINIMGEDDAFNRVPINARPNFPAIQEAPDDMLNQDENSEYINDLTIGKYDLVVTIGPSYTTQRQEILATMMDFIESQPQAGAVIPDLVAKNIDMPNSEEMIKRLRKTVPIGVRDPDEEEKQQAQQQGQQPDMQTIMAMEKLNLEKREQDRKEFDSRIKAITDFAKAEAERNKLQFEKIKEMVGNVSPKN